MVNVFRQKGRETSQILSSMISNETSASLKNYNKIGLSQIQKNTREHVDINWFDTIRISEACLNQA